MTPDEHNPNSQHAGKDKTTEARSIISLYGHLKLLRGIRNLEGQCFPIRRPNTLIGRSSECDIQVVEPAVSRRHAELVWDGQRLILRHLSRVNPTLVNGVSVTDKQILSSGDEIGLADLVLLRLHLHVPGSQPAWRPPVTSSHSGNLSLQHRLEEKYHWEQEILEKFSVVGSFLDIDVVDSYGMKVGESAPEPIVVSFERFRIFLENVVIGHDGHVLNSNGDELMCFFDSIIQAVSAAQAILERLDRFNREDNLLSSPFRVRIGLHSGTALVDRERGVAYSPVLDIAGHLQKAARENELLISEVTFRQLPENYPFEPAGRLKRENLLAYRLSKQPKETKF
jgi:hypothetical protein